MKHLKKINYDYLRTCIEGFEYAIDWYNYWAGENNYPEITINDLIKFLKQEKKKEVHEQIYFPKEIEPTRIDCGEIEGIYYEIWTNVRYPSIKVIANTNISYGGYSHIYGSRKRYTITGIFNDICKIVKRYQRIRPH